MLLFVKQRRPVGRSEDPLWEERSTAELSRQELAAENQAELSCLRHELQVRA